MTLTINTEGFFLIYVKILQNERASGSHWRWFSFWKKPMLECRNENVRRNKVVHKRYSFINCKFASNFRKLLPSIWRLFITLYNINIYRIRPYWRYLFLFIIKFASCTMHSWLITNSCIQLFKLASRTLASSCVYFNYGPRRKKRW